MCAGRAGLASTCLYKKENHLKAVENELQVQREQVSAPSGERMDQHR